MADAPMPPMPEKLRERVDTVIEEINRDYLRPTLIARGMSPEQAAEVTLVFEDILVLPGVVEE